MKLSKKQTKLINDIEAPNVPELSILGSVQSGKTFSIALGVIMYASALHKYDNTRQYNGAIIGWDLDTLKGNILEPLQTWLDKFGYIKDKDYILKFGGNDKYFQIWNIRFYFFGFNTKLSFNKILGRPLIFVWVDESARIYSQLSLQESFDELPRKASKFQWAPVQENNT